MTFWDSTDSTVLMSEILFEEAYVPRNTAWSRVEGVIQSHWRHLLWIIIRQYYFGFMVKYYPIQVLNGRVCRPYVQTAQNLSNSLKLIPLRVNVIYLGPIHVQSQHERKGQRWSRSSYNNTLRTPTITGLCLLFSESLTFFKTPQVSAC